MILELLSKLWFEINKVPTGLRIEVRLLLKVALIMVSLFMIYAIETTSKGTEHESSSNSVECFQLLRETLANLNQNHRSYGGINTNKAFVDPAASGSSNASGAGDMHRRVWY